MSRIILGGILIVGTLTCGCSSSSAPASGTGGAGGAPTGAGGAVTGTGGSAGADGGVAGADGGTAAVMCRPNPPAGSWAQATTMPTPAGMSAANDDAIFIASGGTMPSVQRWNGSALSTDFQGSVADVWAAAPDDVWAVGMGSWHRDAAGWTEVPVPPFPRPTMALLTLWRLGASDIFAGGHGTVIHWNGTAWSALPVPMGTPDGTRAAIVNGVFATSDSNVWAVGTFEGSGPLSALQHWDGTAWTLYSQQGGTWMPGSTGTFPHNAFNAVWGSGASDIWAVGSTEPGNLIHFDGTSWSDVALPGLPTGATLTDVWGACATDVWLVGWTDGAALSGISYHFDGQTWTSMPAPADQLRGITVSASTAWLAGANALYSRPR